MAINAPLFIWAWQKLGKRFVGLTLLCMLTSSLLIDLLAHFPYTVTEEPMLAAVYGGLVTGTGYGICYTTGATAGGTDIRLTAVKQGRFAVVAVADSGPDIPADKLPHIFDRFYRADEARTDGDSFGLGLPIAKAIIDAHRGTLRCESGGGVTRFIITLPLAAGKQERGTDHA